MYQLVIIIIVLFIYFLNYYKLQVDSNKYININKNCDIYSTHCTKKSRFTIKTNNILNSNSNNGEFDPNNSNVDNITFLCPFSTLISKTLNKTPIKHELLVDFNNYYVYNNENQLIDRAVLTTSNTNTNKFLICNEFPNKDCKTVYMYLVDSSPKVLVNISDKISINPESIKARDAPFSDSSLVYDIDIIHKNIVKKHYDPYTNVFEVVLSKQPANSNKSLFNIDPAIASSTAFTDTVELATRDSKSGILGKSRFFNKNNTRGVLLKLDRSNPNLVYELNGVKVNEDLTSLNAFKYNKNKLDSSYVLISHNKVSNKRSFLVIKLKYNCPEPPKSGVLIRVTRLNKSRGGTAFKGINKKVNKNKRKSKQSSSSVNKSNSRTDTCYEGDLKLKIDSKDLAHTPSSVEADRRDEDGREGRAKVDCEELGDAAPDRADGDNDDDLTQPDQLHDAGGADGGGSGLSAREGVFDQGGGIHGHVGVKSGENGDESGSEEAKTEEWRLNDGEEFERSVELGNNYLRVEFIVYGGKTPSGGDADSGANGAEGGEPDGADVYENPENGPDPGRGVSINGFRLSTDHYIVLATRATNYMVKFDNKTYKLAITSNMTTDLGQVSAKDGSGSGANNSGTADAGSGTRAAAGGILGVLSGENVNEWLAKLAVLAAWAFTLVNIGLNAPRFYFEALNYVTFLVLCYGSLTGSRGGGAELDPAGALGEALVRRLLIHVGGSEDLAPAKQALALSAVYAVNAAAVLLYLLNAFAANFDPQLMKRIKKYKLNLFVLFNYLLLLMLLVFLRLDRGGEPIYVAGRKLDSFWFSSITLMLTALIAVILYQLYPRAEVNASLGRSLFQMIEGDIAEYNHTVSDFLENRLEEGYVAPDEAVSSTLAEAIRFNESQKASGSQPAKSLTGVSGSKSLTGPKTAHLTKPTKPKKGDASNYKFNVIATNTTLSNNASENPSNGSLKDVFGGGYSAQAGQGKGRRITFSNGNSRPQKQAAHTAGAVGAPQASDRLGSRRAKRGARRQRVVINDKYRLLYVNAVVAESALVVLCFLLTGSEAGVFLLKSMYWLLVSTFIQSRADYYDERRINKYLLVKALKFLIMASVAQVHVVVAGWRTALETPALTASDSLRAGVARFLSGNLSSVLILLCLNQCVNHRSLRKLQKLFRKLRIA